MEKFAFSPINWDKVGTQHVLIVYHPRTDLVADLETDIERIEANKKGFPREWPLATHCAKILTITEYTAISRSKWFGLKKETHVLTPNTYVFEEGVAGDGYSVLKDKYGDSDCIEIRKRLDQMDESDLKVSKDSTIKYWQMSVSYGWPSFVFQVGHVFGIDLKKKTIRGMQICSEVCANIVNDIRRAKNQTFDFPNPANTNPFDWQVNEIWVRDTDVQP